MNIVIVYPLNMALVGHLNLVHLPLIMAAVAQAGMRNVQTPSIHGRITPACVIQ